MDFGLKFVGLSFVGRRGNNEDSVLAEELSNGAHVFGIADGMGGAEAGEIASAIAVKVMFEHLSSEAENFEHSSRFHLKEIVRTGFMKIQKAISAAVLEDDKLQGMGTTFTVLLIFEDVFVWGNLGDSRLYRFFVNAPSLLTKDHTFIQEYIDNEGELPDDTIQERYGSYLTRTMDGGDSLPDIFPVDKDFEVLNEKSCFLLCSDGLILNKTQDETEWATGIITKTPDVRSGAQQLIASAYHEGSKDNISVCLVEIGRIRRNRVKREKYPYPPENKVGTIIVDKHGKTNNHDKPDRKRIWLFVGLSVLLFGCLLTLLLFGILPGGSGGGGDVTVLATGEGTLPDSAEKITEGPELYNWIPLKEADYRLSMNDSSLIVWQPYGYPGQLVEYEVLVFSETNLVEVFTVGKDRNSLMLKNLTALESDSVYGVRIEAVLLNGERVEGNMVSIKFH